MKALSIRQPWAWAILHAGKDVENREWVTRFKGRIAIHAPKTVDREAIEELRKEGHDVPDNLPTGCFVGEVDVTGCRMDIDCFSPWATGPWCHTLARPKPYAEPIPGPGKLGYFEWDKP